MPGWMQDFYWIIPDGRKEQRTTAGKLVRQQQENLFFRRRLIMFMDNPQSYPKTRRNAMNDSVALFLGVLCAGLGNPPKPGLISRRRGTLAMGRQLVCATGGTAGR